MSARSWLARAAMRRRQRRGKRPVRRAWVQGVAITANIGRKAGAAPVRAYLTRIRDRALEGRDIAVVFFQEIDGGDPANEHVILREVFAEADGWRLEGMTTQTPIAWRSAGRQWQLAGPVIRNRAMAGIPRRSPGRSVLTVVLEEIASPAHPDPDALLVLVGTHFPLTKGDGPALAALRAGWAEVQTAVRRAIRLGRRYEADVIAAADTNSHDTPTWGVRQVLATLPRSIDRLVLVAGRGRIAKVGDTVETPNGVGEPFHPARGAAFTFRPIKEKTR